MAGAPEITRSAKRWQKLTAEQREAYNRYRADWCKRNPDKVRAKNRRYRLANPERVVAGERRRVYGITPSEFGVLLGKQEGLCAICVEPLGPGHKTHLDHDHATGATRGLLCHRCNRGLGQFRDRPALLEKAAGYVTLHSGRAS